MGGPREADVLVVGAGPAGAAAALALGPGVRTLLVDRHAEPVPRIGESLVPAARRVLADLGVLDALEAQGHAPYLGNRSHWGGVSAETDFLRDPDGPGWHLDRPRFERLLRDEAVARGAGLLAPARVDAVVRDGDGWRVACELSGDGGPRRLELRARVLVDAGGRGAPVARRLGAAQRATDRLVATWVRGTTAGEDGASAGFSVVESEPDGWWYSAPVPARDGRPSRVLAFHTDADLLGALLPDAAALVARALALPGLGPLLAHVGFEPAGRLGSTSACSACLSPPAGPGWVAVGDASLGFDPLASRGLFHALYTGLVAGRAVAGAPTDSCGLPGYVRELERIRVAYQRHLAAIHGAERRWPDRPFWARRLAAMPEPASTAAGRWYTRQDSNL